MTKTFLEVLEDPHPTVVHCGTCPVNIACAIERGGNGWKFDCCGSSAVESMERGVLVVTVIDCRQHHFEQIQQAKDCKLCPLCTGDIMAVALRDDRAAVKNRYLPTVHAAVSLEERLRLWKKVLPEHRKREAERGLPRSD